MRIQHTKAFIRSLRGRSEAELQAVAAAMTEAGETFGHPHRHSGVDIRRIAKTIFECRVGLDLRLVFKRAGDALVFDFAGNHDEVEGYLRNR